MAKGFFDILGDFIRAVFGLIPDPIPEEAIEAVEEGTEYSGTTEEDLVDPELAVSRTIRKFIADVHTQSTPLEEG